MTGALAGAGGPLLAGRLPVPAGTAAVLWDMDGVLLDTLRLDLDCVTALLRSAAPGSAGVDATVIRRNFAYDPPEFWRRLLAAAGVDLPPARRAALVEEYERLRATAVPALNPGIAEILRAAREQGLRQAVVSNNPAAAVRTMLGDAGILDRFDAVVGNDRPGLASKPAPDTYLEAARVLGVEPGRCVVVEDSLLGGSAGRAAGCVTVGVATGGCDLDELVGSALFDACVESFRGAAAPGDRR